MTSDQLRACRRSDTVFIFGSGYSLNEIGPSAWSVFGEHDTFGLSGFIYQRWVRVDFHLVRGWADDPPDLEVERATAPDYAAELERNEHFHNAVLLLQSDHTATFANTLIGHRLLSRGRRIYRYKTARRLDDLPSRHFSYGLTHGASTLTDCVNAAYLMGWKQIVLVGVDLYDTRYFWGPADQHISEPTRQFLQRFPKRSWNERHLSSQWGIVEQLKRWTELFADEGVALSVYNQRSLLRGVMPVYESPESHRSVESSEWRHVTGNDG